MLTSFKKQLEDAGYSLAKAQEAQKVAEEGAKRFREHAYEAAKAKQKAEEDARLAAEEKRNAEEDARQAIYAKQQVEEELRKAAEAKRQVEERDANENEVVRREMEARIVKAMEEVRKATEAKQRAEEDVRNVVEAKRQAEAQATNEREVARKEAETSMAKVLEDAEAKRKVLEERTMRAEEGLKARTNVQSNRLGKGKAKDVAACASDDDALAIELQLKDREEEARAGTRQVSITDVNMGEVEGDGGVQVEWDSAGEGMVIDIPHDKEWRAQMPGALIVSGHLTNVQPTANGSRRRDKVQAVQDIRPWKSSQRASGNLKVANADTVITAHAIVGFVSLT